MVLSTSAWSTDHHSIKLTLPLEPALRTFGCSPKNIQIFHCWGATCEWTTVYALRSTERYLLVMNLQKHIFTQWNQFYGPWKIFDGTRHESCGPWSEWRECGELTRRVHDWNEKARLDPTVSVVWPQNNNLQTNCTLWSTRRGLYKKGICA